MRRTKGGTNLLKRSAFNLSHHGFLLVEHLIAICVISILMMTLIHFISMIDHFQTNLNQATSQELTALSTQLQKEAKTATHFSTDESTLQIHLANGTVTSYNISNHRLMRQVDGKGGEVALYHCEKIDIMLHQPQCVTLKLYTSKDKTYDIYLSSSLFPIERETLDEQ